MIVKALIHFTKLIVPRFMDCMRRGCFRSHVGHRGLKSWDISNLERSAASGYLMLNQSVVQALPKM